MKEESLRAGIHFLADAGLNLFTILDCSLLPPTLVTRLTAAKIPVKEYRHLVLTGNGGRRFWISLKQVGLNSIDPVDYFSTELTRQFIRGYLEDSAYLLLFPNTEFHLPLIELGELSGWSRPSPLGQGIHPEFGLWFAYRSAFFTNYELPIKKTSTASWPCLTCAAKPCLSHCPPKATHLSSFDLAACIGFRLRTGSPCADRCLARLACPIGNEHQYPLEQIHYHYHQSLITIQEYELKKKEQPPPS